MMNENIYKKTISNDYLGVREEVKGTSPAEVKAKAEARLARWARQEKRQRERTDLVYLKELAEYDTLQAEQFVEECKNILQANLNAGRKIDWVSLYDDKPFPPFVFKESIPRGDLIAKEIGVPEKDFLAELFSPSTKARRINLENQAKQVFDEQLKQYEKRKEAARTAYENQRATYIEEQSEYNRSVDQLQLDYEKGHPDAVESIVRIALANVRYPDEIKVGFDALYDQSEKLIVLNTILPVPGDVPRTIHYQYNEEEHRITTMEMKQKDFNRFYESLLFQITLSAIYVVFESIHERHIQWVGFNGWIKGRDSETGEEFKSCILTCKVSRDVFDSFDLAKISPKECFIGLGGVMVEPLTDLTPVQPIVNIERVPSLYPEIERTPTEVTSPKPAEYKPIDFGREVKEILEEVYEQIEKDLIDTNQDKKDKKGTVH